MSALDDIEQILNGEKLRAVFEVNDFRKNTGLFAVVADDGLIDDLDEKCNEYITENSKTIWGAYFKGLCSYHKGDIEGGAFSFQKLVNHFRAKEDWKVLKYITEKALEFGNNKALLKAYSKTLEALGENENLPDIWRTIVRIDRSETDFAEKLAYYYEEEDRDREAIPYYHVLLNEYISSKNEDKMETIWKKLIDIDGDNLDVFFDFSSDMLKKGLRKRSAQLLLELYKYYEALDDAPVKLQILKKIAAVNSEEKGLRDNIVATYTEIYKDHSNVEQFINDAGFESRKKKLADAIDTFEKHILFDENNFIQHRTWGIGKITEFKNNKLKIDFSSGKKGHVMSLEMALTSLSPLAKDHIEVMRVYEKDHLIELVENPIPENIEKLARMTLTSYDHPLSSKEIKATLCPVPVSAESWNRWWTKCRSLLKTNPAFIEVKTDTFEIRTQKQPLESELLEKFKTGDLKEKMVCFEDLAMTETADEEKKGKIAENLSIMAKTLSLIMADEKLDYTEQACIYAYLTLYRQKLDGIEITDLPAAAGIEQIRAVSTGIESRCFKVFMTSLKVNNPTWIELYEQAAMLHLENSKLFLLKELEKEAPEHFSKTIKDILNSDDANSIIVLSKNLLRDQFDWERIDIDKEYVFVALFRVLEKIERNLKNSAEVNENKKHLRTIEAFFFDKKNNLLEDYIRANPDTRVIELLENTRYIDTAAKYHLVQKFKKLEAAPIVRTAPSQISFFVTRASYDKRFEKLNHMKSVESTEISAEIARAREKGDLKENAEYIAARDKQGMLNRDIFELEQEFEKVTVVEAKDVKADTIGFGVKFKILDLEENEEREYFMFGPWESDVEKGVLSYQAPFAAAMLGKKAGEEFTYNDVKYRVISIENGIS